MDNMDSVLVLPMIILGAVLGLVVSAIGVIFLGPGLWILWTIGGLAVMGGLFGYTID